MMLTYNDVTLFGIKTLASYKIPEDAEIVQHKMSLSSFTTLLVKTKVEDSILFIEVDEAVQMPCGCLISEDSMRGVVMNAAKTRKSKIMCPVHTS